MGKAYRTQTSRDRLKKQQSEIKDLQAINRIRNTPRPVASTAFSGASPGGSSGGTGNFLATKGDTMTGPFALGPPVDFSIEIDVNGIIDIGESSSNSQYSSNIQLEDIQPNTFTLDTIAGAAFDGQILILRTFAPNSPFTIAAATLTNGGNIQTPDSNDVTGVGDLQMIVFVFDEALKIEQNTGGSWRLLNTFGTGGGGDISFPIRPPVTTGLPTTGNVILNLNQTSGHYFTIGELTGDIDISITNPPAANTAQAFRINIIKGATDFTVTFNDSLLVQPFIGAENTTTLLAGDIYDGAVFNIFTMTSTAGSGSPIEFWANFPAVSDIDYATFDGVNIDRLLFDQAAGDSLGATQTGITSDANGNLLFNSLDEHIFSVDGNPVAKFEDAGSGVLELGMLNHAINSAKDISFDKTTEFAGAGAIPTIGFDNSDAEFIYNTPDGATHKFVVNNSLAAEISAGAFTFADGFTIVGNPNATTPGLNVGQVAGDPSDITNGNIWYNATTDKLNARINEVIVDLGAGANVVFADNVFRIQDNLDATKQIAFQASGITTGTIRTITMPDQNLTLVSNTLNNLGTTSINAALLPDASATLDLGSELLPWRIAHFREIEFPVTTSAPIGSTDTQISVNTSNNMAFNNSVNGGGFLWYFEGINNFSMTSSTFTGPNFLASSTITINDSSTNPSANGQFSRNGLDLGIEIPIFSVRRTTTVGAEFTSLNIVKVDASPATGDALGKINYQIEDTGVITTYASIQTIIQESTDATLFKIQIRSENTLQDAFIIEGNDNNTQFQYLMSSNGNTRMQPLSDSRMGYFVTPQVIDFSLNVGTAGTLEFPRINDGSPSLSTLNGAAGAFNTSLVVHDIADGTLYVKTSNTSWDAYARTSTVPP